MLHPWELTATWQSLEEWTINPRGSEDGTMGLEDGTATPVGQSIEPMRIILEPYDEVESALLGFGSSWDLSPFTSFLFLPWDGNV